MTSFSPSRQKRQKDKKGIAAVNLLVIFGFAVLLTVFLIQYDSLIGKDYELRRSQKTFSEQEALAKKLEVALTKANSVANLEQLAEDLNLVAVEKAKYLEPLQPSVALFKNLNP